MPSINTSGYFPGPADFSSPASPFHFATDVLVKFSDPLEGIVFLAVYYPIDIALPVSSHRAKSLALVPLCRFLHGDVLFDWFWWILHRVLVLHVPPPIILTREGLAAALLRVRTAANRAVVLSCFVVLIIDVPVQMCFGTKSLVTLRALMRALVIALVVTVEVVSQMILECLHVMV